MNVLNEWLMTEQMCGSIHVVKVEGITLSRYFLAVCLIGGPSIPRQCAK
jgi:hypothetical protein